MRITKQVLLLIGIILPVISSCCSDTDIKSEIRKSVYYLSSMGDDKNFGTKESPWKTLSKLNDFHFNPGDSVLFARGTQFEGGFIISSSGSPDSPIVFSSYGEGALPTFSNTDFTLHYGNVLQITGSHIVINGLMFHDCATVEYDSIGQELWRRVRKLGAIYIAERSNHNIIRNCEIVRTPVGIKVYGQYNLITHNYIHDNNEPMAPHWGPLAVVVCTSNNEIAYNHFENLVAPSEWYGHDGGAIEIDDRNYPKHNIMIHHNLSLRNQGFIEFVGRCIQENMIIHHNVCMDYQSFIGFTGPCKNMKVENNTVVRVLAHENPDSEDVIFWSYFEDENIQIRNNIFYYDPSKIEQVYSRGEHPRAYNLYYRSDDPKLSDHASVASYNRFVLGGGAWLGEGDKIGNPLFVDLEKQDFHLREDSPAIDAGTDLGYKIDFDGNKVPSGEAPDIGAYEYQREID